VLYHVNGVPGERRPRRRKAVASRPPEKQGIENFTPQEVADVAASFQQAVVDVLRIKLRRAAESIGARTLVVGGGVAANSALRRAAETLAERGGYALRLSEPRFCVDNAAMTAGLAWHYLRTGKVDDLLLEAHPTVRR